MTTKKYTIEEIIKYLKKEEENETIEGQLLKPKLVRELYKQLGNPTEEDFPNEYKIAGRCWKKIDGYTKDFGSETKRLMDSKNNRSTNWCVARPSMTKINIVEEYTKAGWSCIVQSYNVMCTRYAQHPKYKDLYVKFYSSRDCNKYEYVLVADENE